LYKNLALRGGDSMITIKEYAEHKNVSYEAVRQQVVRYRNELEGHVFIQGRTQYMDEEAVAFLDQKRAANPVVVMEEQKNDELEALQMKVEALTNQLMANQQEMIALQKESRELLEQNHEKQLLLTKNEQKIADYDRIHEAYAKSNMQKMAAETETQRLRQEKEQAEQNYRALEQYAREKINSLETMTPREFRKYKKQLKKGE
jgi:hypothetical protein